jgi:hypothetical protein
VLTDDASDEALVGGGDNMDTSEASSPSPAPLRGER